MASSKIRTEIVFVYVRPCICVTATDMMMRACLGAMHLSTFSICQSDSSCLQLTPYKNHSWLCWQSSHAWYKYFRVFFVIASPGSDNGRLFIAYVSVNIEDNRTLYLDYSLFYIFSCFFPQEILVKICHTVCCSNSFPSGGDNAPLVWFSCRQ